MKIGCLVFVIIGLVVVMLPAVGAQPPTSEGPVSVLESVQSKAESFRQKESELQMLQMEVDRLKLEVEKKKAMAELKSPLGGADGVFMSLSSGAVKDPDIELKYVVLSDEKQRAVVEIDGHMRDVHVNDELPEGVVKSIEPTGVVLVSKDGKESCLTIDEN